MKKFCSLLFIIILLSLFTTEVSAKSFPDLPNWADKEIHYLYKENIVKGFPNGTFGSSSTINRGDATLMLARAKGLNIGQTNTVINFSDVTKSMYYYNAIQAATDAGYLAGYPNGQFAPKETLKRKEMAKIISDAFELTGRKGSSFSDTSTSWAKYEIESLATNGISIGFPNGSFQPEKSITRAEFSVMLARAMNNTNFKVEAVKNLKVYFIDVGQGDSTLIQTPDGANILIDGGLREKGEKVVEFLTLHDVEKLDLVIATHPHIDHIGGLLTVLDHIPVDKFIDSGRTYTTRTYHQLMKLIDDKNIPFEIPTIGQVFSFDNNIKLSILHVDPNAEIVNDASVVSKIEYDDVSIMITGDAERLAEESLVASKFDLTSKILKAGHHGSFTSSIHEFVQAVNPKDVIFSNEKGHIHGHPHNSVVNRFRKMGAKMHTTNDGDITLITNGISYSINAKPWEPRN